MIYMEKLLARRNPVKVFPYFILKTIYRSYKNVLK
mgnify:CR=1 FL=1